ncbi:hypothetical protein [Burkholderia sp. BCC1638]|uniref:hypothetical protein n=1 Tax=Burkholderia sp. BCC1638 TaxID=2681391 RepID=UPI00158C0404|nr:hypothetical protein [Burkholderia sp. BCC1638]
MSDIALGSIDRNRRGLDEKMTVMRRFFSCGNHTFYAGIAGLNLAMPRPPGDRFIR